jgi:hypothetical protein
MLDWRKRKEQEKVKDVTEGYRNFGKTCFGMVNYKVVRWLMQCNSLPFCNVSLQSASSGVLQSLSTWLRVRIT